MTMRVLVEAEAVDRLSELGLSVEVVERVIRRADAEASMCTPLDPPSMPGLTRWGRTTRFLREELIPIGWGYDNPRNLARTVHPDGQVAIVATSGDAMTGLPDHSPTTKYPKGLATVEAVQANDQLALDLGDFDPTLDEDQSVDPAGAQTWYLLYHVGEEEFRVELSLPDAIENGWITRWAERIILPALPREDDDLTGTAEFGDDQDLYGDIVVEVNRR